MNLFTLYPGNEPKPTGSILFRFVLALIMFLCLSYATFASPGIHSTVVAPPVEFNSFSLARTADRLEFRWMVSQETDVKYYVIEQSADGRHYKELAIVFPFEDQSLNNAYAVKLANLKKGKYFRIKSVDNAMEATFSSSKEVGE